MTTSDSTDSPSSDDQNVNIRMPASNGHDEDADDEAESIRRRIFPEPPPWTAAGRYLYTRKILPLAVDMTEEDLKDYLRTFKPAFPNAVRFRPRQAVSKMRQAVPQIRSRLEELAKEHALVYHRWRESMEEESRQPDAKALQSDTSDLKEILTEISLEMEQLHMDLAAIEAKDKPTSAPPAYTPAVGVKERRWMGPPKQDDGLWSSATGMGPAPVSLTPSTPIFVHLAQC